MIKKILSLFITITLLILLFSSVPNFISPRLIETLWPIGHVVSFAFWCWLLIIFIPQIRNSSSNRQLVILIVLTLIIGGTIELIQPFFSRNAQLSDIFYNLLGTLFVYLFWGNFLKISKYIILFRALYLIAFAYILFPAIQVVRDEYSTYVDFPIIAKFDSAAEITRWKADLPLAIVNSSDLSVPSDNPINLMKGTFAKEIDSRIVLRYFSGNWKGYKQVKFSFFNPNNKTLKVRLIITDHFYDQENSENQTANYQDRFGRWLLIKPGWSEEQVNLEDIKVAPKLRKMDLTGIAGVDFYMYKLSEPVNLYFSKIELISN